MPDWVRARSWEILLAVILIVSVLYNASQSDAYLTVPNFVNLFHLSIEKVIVALIMAFVIINGEIDLSVGSVMAFSAAVMATIHESGLWGTEVPFGVAIVIALMAGATAGLIHGLVVVKAGLPSLVVTLAGLIGWRGAARILTEDRSVGGFPDWFGGLARDDLLGPLPFPLVLAIAGFIVGGVILHRTALGRTIFVIGNNPEVARYSGIDVARTKLRLFVTSGLVASFAGVLFAARLGSVRGNIAQGFELDIITMVLLGGVSIFGGSGTLLGVALSITIVLNIRNGLGLANVEGQVQTGVIGLLLIMSVLARNLADRYLLRPRGDAGAPTETPPAGEPLGPEARAASP
jgi:rhamnose transport system permease protein